MFITTPFVHFGVNRLYMDGRITQYQRESLIRLDRQLNIVTTFVVAVVIAAYFLV